MPLRRTREQCGGALHDNGVLPWPTSADYLHQPKRQACGVLHRLALNNQSNTFAVLVKLEAPAAPQQLAEVFITATTNIDIKVNLAEE